MSVFSKRLSASLTDLGFTVEMVGNTNSIRVDGLFFEISEVDSYTDNRVFLMCKSRFSVRPNGTVPNLDKAVGLVTGRVLRRRKQRLDSSHSSKGEGAMIAPAPGGVILTVQFKDHASASIALDCLLENGLVAHKEKDKDE